MKLHKLYEPVEIIKESEKAVAVKNIEITEETSNCMNQCLISHIPYYAHLKPFWIPKSQIEIQNNKIVAITKWIYNQLLVFSDCPITLDEDVKKIEKKYETYISKKIKTQNDVHNSIYKKEK